MPVQQNGMSETIQEHEDKLGELGVRTDKIKRELNETFVQVENSIGRSLIMKVSLQDLHIVTFSSSERSSNFLHSNFA